MQLNEYLANSFLSFCNTTGFNAVLLVLVRVKKSIKNSIKPQIQLVFFGCFVGLEGGCLSLRFKECG